jgi:uncharacterized Ntn-hydrolase superfamily protein
MTFSIAARCPTTGMFAIAVSSSSPAVAARCAHARAKVGVVAVQNITNPALGPRGLDLLAEGRSAVDALAQLMREEPFIEFRQISIIDREGRAATHSGNRTLGTYHAQAAQDVACAGNLLKSPQVIAAMLANWSATGQEHIGDRVLAAMRAGVAAGGEEGPVHSAGMLIVDRTSWPLTDLRVDWHETDPIGELKRIWELWRPQMDAYITRALNPGDAPSFGVPGDQ